MVRHTVSGHFTLLRDLDLDALFYCFINNCQVYRSHVGETLKGGYHDDATENRYAVTALASRHIHDVTNEDVTKRSERATLS